MQVLLETLTLIVAKDRGEIQAITREKRRANGDYRKERGATEVREKTQEVAR